MVLNYFPTIPPLQVKRNRNWSVLYLADNLTADDETKGAKELSAPLILLLTDYFHFKAAVQLGRGCDKVRSN